MKTWQNHGEDTVRALDTWLLQCALQVNGSRLVKLTVHAAGDPAFRTWSGGVGPKIWPTFYASLQQWDSLFSSKLVKNVAGMQLWKFSLNCHKPAGQVFLKIQHVWHKTMFEEVWRGFLYFSYFHPSTRYPRFLIKTLVLSGTGSLPSELLVLPKGDLKRWWEWWLTLGGSCTFEAVLCSRCSSMCHDLQWRVRWR